MRNMLLTSGIIYIVGAAFCLLALMYGRRAAAAIFNSPEPAKASRHVALLLAVLWSPSAMIAAWAIAFTCFIDSFGTGLATALEPLKRIETTTTLIREQLSKDDIEISVYLMGLNKVTAAFHGGQTSWDATSPFFRGSLRITDSGQLASEPAKRPDPGFRLSIERSSGPSREGYVALFRAKDNTLRLIDEKPITIKEGETKVDFTATVSDEK
jgi:hypothetical protein